MWRYTDVAHFWVASPVSNNSVVDNAHPNTGAPRDISQEVDWGWSSPVRFSERGAAYGRRNPNRAATSP